MDSFIYSVLSKLNIVTLKRVLSLNHRLQHHRNDELFWRYQVDSNVELRHLDSVIDRMGWRRYALLFSPRRMKHIYQVRNHNTELIEIYQTGWRRRKPFTSVITTERHGDKVVGTNGDPSGADRFHVLTEDHELIEYFLDLDRRTLRCKQMEKAKVEYLSRSTFHDRYVTIDNNDEIEMSRYFRFKSSVGRVIQILSNGFVDIFLTEDGRLYEQHDVSENERKCVELTPIIPVPIIKFSFWSWGHIIALGVDGSVWRYYDHNEEDDGDPEPEERYTLERLVVPHIIDLRGATSNNAGNGVFLLTTDGDVYAYGYNASVVLGMDDYNHFYEVPTKIEWWTKTVQQAIVGFNHSVLIDSEGVILFGTKSTHNERTYERIVPPTTVHDAVFLDYNVFLLGE